MSKVVFELWGQRGWPQVDVAGETHHLREIQRLLPRRLPASGAEIDVVCQLVPEPRNKFDRNAVRVESSGALLGYLDRDDAARYTGILSALVAQGYAPETAGRIWARPPYEGDRSGPYVSVRLDLAEPHMVVPMNGPPAGEYVLLPRGNAVQVAGEEQHMAALRPWTRPEGEGWVFATLHPIDEQLARSSRVVVEVRIEGQKVGQLTPKMSGEWLPVLELVDGTATTCAVRAVVKGNALKADVNLYAARAGELPPEVMNRLVGLRQTARPAAESVVQVAAVSSPPDFQSAPPPLAPAAWYPDPVRESPLRWWDGQRWTEHVHAGAG